MNIELANQIKSGEHPQFILNTEKEQVECRCGHLAVWLRDGYLCGTITAYPCKYNKINKYKSKYRIQEDKVITQNSIVQYRTAQSSDWQNLPGDKDQFTAEFLEGYHGRADVDLTYEVACVLNGDYKHKTLEWFRENYPEYKNFSLDQLEEKLNVIETKLFNEAKKDFNDKVKLGIIEIRSN